MSKNAIKEKSEEPKVSGQAPKGGNRVTRTVGSVLSGSFLSRDQTIRALPFIFFLTLLAICYIANGYYAEDQIRKVNKVTNQIKELRSEFIIVKSDLMFVSKQSEVAQRALPLGIKESVTPPKKIEIKKSTSTTVQP